VRQPTIENFIPIHAVLFNRNVLAKGCWFDETLSFCEDWDFWLQIQQHGIFSFIPEIGANYLIHDHGSFYGDRDNESSKVYEKWLSIWKIDTFLEILCL
jgi:hypothetical protein